MKVGIKLETKVFFGEFEIHTTPLEKIEMDAYSFTIFLDDIHEQRNKITVSPYQAFKVVTIDFVSSKDYYNDYCYRDGRFHKHILEITDSEWIKEFQEKLKDNGNIFLNDAKHYVLPLQENIVEFITNKEIVIEKDNGNK